MDFFFWPWLICTAGEEMMATKQKKWYWTKVLGCFYEYLRLVLGTISMPASGHHNITAYSIFLKELKMNKIVEVI